MISQEALSPRQFLLILFTAEERNPLKAKDSEQTKNWAKILRQAAKKSSLFAKLPLTALELALTVARQKPEDLDRASLRAEIDLGRAFRNQKFVHDHPADFPDR